jgi:hypothetical protein
MRSSPCVCRSSAFIVLSLAPVYHMLIVSISSCECCLMKRLVAMPYVHYLMYASLPAPENSLSAPLIIIVPHVIRDEKNQIESLGYPKLNGPRLMGCVIISWFEIEHRGPRISEIASHGR